MSHTLSKSRFFILAGLGLLSVFFLQAPFVYAFGTATTTAFVSVCGNGIPDGFKVCDDGFGNNTGAYGSSTVDRHCNSTCSAYGPYCGDGILQPQFGEACDDGNNISGDRCSSSCQIEDLPTTGGGGGGGGGNYSPGGYSPPPATQVIITGKAYPNANVHILKDGTDIAIVQADNKADFYYSTTSVAPGVTTFGFWAQDATGLKSSALTTTLSVTSNVVTTISGEFLPPTINLDKQTVSQGDVLNIFGQAPPQISVITHVHSDNEVLANATSDLNGNWKVALDTSNLADESLHTVSAQFQTNVAGSVVDSAYSQSVSFYVGHNGVGQKGLTGDLNGDSKVNLADFSILLYYWGTPGPSGDLNRDGTVDLTDLSILLFNWTG